MGVEYNSYHTKDSKGKLLKGKHVFKHYHPKNQKNHRAHALFGVGKKFHKKFLIIILSIFLILLMFEIKISQYITIYPFNDSSFYRDNIGIIDLSLHRKHANVETDEVITNRENENHGDKLLSFLDNMKIKNKIYYYQLPKNNIRSKDIEKGIIWLEKKEC